MRIIAGSARGRVLKSPRSNRIRPTADKVKAAFYSMTGISTIREAKFLDLFAGTGNMGIEALSRGAKKCVFVDRDKKSAGLIKENVHLLGFEKKAEILTSDARLALKILAKNEETFNVIYIDPPYRVNQVDIVIQLIDSYKLLEAGGLIGVERDRRDHCLWLEGIPFHLQQQKKYGETKLYLFKG